MHEKKKEILMNELVSKWGLGLIPGSSMGELPFWTSGSSSINWDSNGDFTMRVQQDKASKTTQSSPWDPTDAQEIPHESSPAQSESWLKECVSSSAEWLSGHCLYGSCSGIDSVLDLASIPKDCLTPLPGWSQVQRPVS